MGGTEIFWHSLSIALLLAGILSIGTGVWGFLLCILPDRCWGVLQMLHFNDTLDLDNKLNDSETLKTERKCAHVVVRDFAGEQSVLFLLLFRSRLHGWR